MRTFFKKCYIFQMVKALHGWIKFLEDQTEWAIFPKNLVFYILILRPSFQLILVFFFFFTFLPSFKSTFFFNLSLVIQEKNTLNPVGCSLISHQCFPFSIALLQDFIHFQHALGGFHYPIKPCWRDKAVCKLP